MAYAILRSIPNKLGGVLALGASILVLFVCPLMGVNSFQGLAFYPVSQVYFWSHVNVVVLLS